MIFYEHVQMQAAKVGGFYDTVLTKWVSDPLPLASGRPVKVATALVAFDVRFTNGDHKLRQLAVLAAGWFDPRENRACVDLTVTFRDNSSIGGADDPFDVTAVVLVLVTTDPDVAVHHAAPVFSAREGATPVVAGSSTQIEMPLEASRGAAKTRAMISAERDGRSAVFLSGFDLDFVSDDHYVQRAGAWVDVEPSPTMLLGEWKLTATADLWDQSGNAYDDPYRASVTYSWLVLPPDLYTTFAGSLTMQQSGTAPETPVLAQHGDGMGPSVVALRGFRLLFTAVGCSLRCAMAALDWPTSALSPVQVGFRGGLGTSDNWNEPYTAIGHYSGITGQIGPLRFFKDELPAPPPPPPAPPRVIPLPNVVAVVDPSAGGRTPLKPPKRLR